MRLLILPTYVSHLAQYLFLSEICSWDQEILLWDLSTGLLAREYTGLRRERHMIRSCFGGADDTLVVSGSEGTQSCDLFPFYCSRRERGSRHEDGRVYVWHRDRGILLDILAGHGRGSVNSVAWNPRNTQMFASCSDDYTIRLWEPSAGGVV